MAVVRELSESQSRLSQILTTDFCPGANRFVYWLKEPIGWFVLATLASVLVGTFVSPLGWTLAAGLTAVLIFGIGFPWLAIRGTRCSLHPASGELYERQASYLELSVQNLLPLPIMGLMVEGYLTSSVRAGETDTDLPESALERIPALSTAIYRLPICAEYRGCYPKVTPRITCAFPFGLWTAKREIENISPVTVFPLLIPISDELEFAGEHLAELGMGDRSATQGDFLGVREFRRGDSLKSIHWVQSARQDQLVVCERGGPQNQALELHLSTAPTSGTEAERQENLAWRVRVAASLVDLLSARHLPFRLIIDGKLNAISDSAASRKLSLQLLAKIPLSGSPADRFFDGFGADSLRSKGGCWLTILPVGAEESLQPAAFIRVEIGRRVTGLRQQRSTSRLINLDDDITTQLNHWLSETVHA
jgi:uncharacterized protein (DUF58 family)